jgi:3-deoxy-D-manno-octulosonic acid kinase
MMETNPIRISTFGPYRFGTCLELGQTALEQLCRLFEASPGSAAGLLSGRTGPVLADIPGAGAVVVKRYMRGGLIRHLVKDRYLGIGASRSRREYETLETVRSLGVSSPEPLVWAVGGRLFYRAFLVTRLVPGTRPLSNAEGWDEGACRVVVEKTAGEIRRLIEHRIHHVDLHPGNVLVDEDGGVHIIDFDKARRVRWRREKLCAAYIKRWKRAVEKYSLPQLMADHLVEGLER